MDALWKGIAIGFAIAAPVGPIGVLCIRRSIAEGRLAGFVTGMGAATADTIYGFLAAFGVTLLIDLFTRFQTQIQLLGGLFLLYLGYSLIRAPATVRDAQQPLHARNLWAAYLGATVLTMANPLTIGAFTGIFAALGIGHLSEGYGESFRLVLGVSIGSSLWWLFLSGIAGLIGPRLNTGALKKINIAAGCLVLGAAGWQLASVAMHWANRPPSPAVHKVDAP
ncbi:MAG TPA: LysE family transporter [Opitutaceae bacterium]|nr:LysE family transporter [Opitutaceae bacterium]